MYIYLQKSAAFNKSAVAGSIRFVLHVGGTAREIPVRAKRCYCGEISASDRTAFSANDTMTLCPGRSATVVAHATIWDAVVPKAVP